ncbi:Hypothetical Protein FCC1311_036312 [Hondaea fermentalgiana]|uniref:Uncharacterized protein n=1 Tax=Hondaea fermentalgiana TaxID=2315210 RepID=A0A2R5GAR5_9STRA|nr:Hypothetical Protein FCC1311_036312 [Hondaea fermentalgiana]|eukprot:GBG27409.1 Hypothetical Protein FCC1311_036312 [Hondaea fermentalgiana]
MFDLSLGQLAMIGTAAYMFLGRQEMMAGARIAGRLLGRSVVRINTVRAQAMEAINSEGLSNVRPELREGFQNFMELQNEIRAASMNPVHSVQQTVMSEMAAKRAAQQGQQSEGEQQGEMPQITKTSHPGSAALRERAQGAAEAATAASASTTFSAPYTSTGGHGGMEMTTEAMQGGADIILRGIEYRKVIEAYEEMEKSGPKR